MKHKRILLLDTEALSLAPRFIYDLGFIVLDWDEDKKEYLPLIKEQYIIKQVWDNPLAMKTSYFLGSGDKDKSEKENKEMVEGKKAQYVKLFKSNAGKGIKLKRHWGYVMRKLDEYIETFEITAWAAFNSAYDKGAFKQTAELLNSHNPLEDLDEIDVHKVARVIYHTEEYQEMANAQKWVTDGGNLQTNAERTYAFMIGDPDYVEPHTSLQDALIEMEILNYALQLDPHAFENNLKKFIPSNVWKCHSFTLVDRKKETEKEYKFFYHKKTKSKKKGLILYK